MLNKKNILLFTDWYEPGFKAGGPIQSCKNIVALLRYDFNFYIVTSDRDLGDKDPYENVIRDQWLNHAEGVRICYTSAGWLTSARIKKIFEETGPAIVYMNSMFSYRYSLMPLWVLKKINFQGRIILAPRGMLRASALATKKWKKKVFLTLVKTTDFPKLVTFHATDEEEITDIHLQFGKDVSTILAPNVPSAAGEWQPRQKKPGHLNCLYVSRIHPIKNLLFALEVLSAVNKGREISFDIYGTIDDHSYYTKCFEAARKLEKRIVVNFMGPVEHRELFTLFQQYHLFFLPTQGENFGHAIFEALSFGCPVLISNKTPWNNVLQAGAGWAVPLSDREKFSEVVQSVADMGEPEMNELSRRAYDVARNFITNADFKTKYLKLFGSDTIINS